MVHLYTLGPDIPILYSHRTPDFPTFGVPLYVPLKIRDGRANLQDGHGAQSFQES